MAEKEYIERELAKEIFRNGKHTVKWLIESGAKTIGDSFAMLLDEVPAADVREVVLCRDCTHYKMVNKGKPWKANRCYCTRSAAVATDPDDFCSRGETRSADMRICSTNYTNPATTGENREVSDVRAWLNNGAELICV